MFTRGAQGLCKSERLTGKKQIELLFEGSGSKSMSAWPVRMVYLKTDRASDDVQAKILVSVSKRHFKHAVDRNRIKRQMREAYRLNKQQLLNILAQTPDKCLLMALMWMSDEHKDSEEVSSKVCSLLQRLTEKLSAQ